ncbi:SDR family NAD(P)-dependent oxidoreductase [Pseudochryseolinea flava]|nr:SDR family NAD(P)-dependent oxidoreductase [Pseudochryseolinea flava]
MRLITLYFVLICLSRPHAFCQEKTHSTEPYALVAGGSKGIEHAIAEALAKRKFNLILVARHLDALENAAHQLEERYGVDVEILQYDLSEETSAEKISTWCIERKIPLKVLCNVAGYGGVNDYLSLPLDTLRYMVNLNLESCMALTQLLLPLLSQNKPAYVLNVSSMAGFAPIPSKNMYSATKSAVVFFSYSLRNQLRKKDISVSCLAPGPVYTKPSIKKDTESKLGWLGKKMAVRPQRVGEVSVKRMLKGRMLIIPGTLAKTTSVLIRVLPRDGPPVFIIK